MSGMMQFWNFKVEISTAAGDLAREWYVILSSTIVPSGSPWFRVTYLLACAGHTLRVSSEGTSRKIHRSCTIHMSATSTVHDKYWGSTCAAYTGISKRCVNHLRLFTFHIIIVIWNLKARGPKSRGL